MDEKLSKIIGRINQLRAISCSTHSKAERETTLLIAAKLIAQHQLDEAQLIVETGNAGEPIDLDSESIIYESGRLNAWKSELALSLAQLNGLFVYNAQVRNAETHRKGNRYRVIGRRSDIEVALYFMSYLTAMISDLSYDYVPKAHDAKRGVNPERESWSLGCVRGYVAKMKAERDEVNRAGTSSALVFIGNKAQEAKAAWQEKTGIKLTKSTYRSHAQHNSETFNSGYKKGQTLTVNQGLGGNNSPTPKLIT